MIPSSAVNCEFLTGIPRQNLEDSFAKDSEIYVICDCKVTAAKAESLPADAIVKVVTSSDAQKPIRGAVDNYILYYYNTHLRKV